MSEEDFRKIDSMSIEYKYIEKNPIKILKKKIDFTNEDLILAFIIFALGLLVGFFL